MHAINLCNFHWDIPLVYLTNTLCNFDRYKCSISLIHVVSHKTWNNRLKAKTFNPGGIFLRVLPCAPTLFDWLDLTFAWHLYFLYIQSVTDMADISVYLQDEVKSMDDFCCCCKIRPFLGRFARLRFLCIKWPNLIELTRFVLQNNPCC